MTGKHRVADFIPYRECESRESLIPSRQPEKWLVIRKVVLTIKYLPNRKGITMTETTDSRQIRLLVTGILAKYDIDDLLLEIDLSEAFKQYLQARQKSRDKAGIRERIMADMEIAAARQTKNEEMESRIFKATGLYVNERWYQDGIIDFLIEKDRQGETIEVFATACKADPYKMPKLFKIAEKPSYLRDVWGLAFVDRNAGNDNSQRLPEILS